jgi:hypothetical protein
MIFTLIGCVRLMAMGPDPLQRLEVKRTSFVAKRDFGVESDTTRPDCRFGARSLFQ